MTQQEQDFRKVLGLDDIQSSADSSEPKMPERPSPSPRRQPRSTVKRKSSDQTTSVVVKTIGVSPELYKRIRALSYYLTLTKDNGHTVNIAETVRIMLDDTMKHLGKDAVEFVDKYSG